MEKYLEDLVEMVRRYPEGIQLKKLRPYFLSTYHRNLCPVALGFNSMSNLVDNIDDLILIPGPKYKIVFHLEHNPPVSLEEADSVFENIIEMLRGHPNGYGIQSLATAYRQKYNTKLFLRTLGFATMEALVESLSDHLVIVEKRVFHVMHRAQEYFIEPEDNTSSSQLHGDFPSADLSSLGPPRCAMAPNFSPPNLPTEEPSTAPRLTEEHLLQRVMEVMILYNLYDPPMNRLQSCYLEHFGSELPFAQYLSLYDNMASQVTPIFTKPVAPQEPTVLRSRRRDLKDLVELVRQFPEGIPLETLIDHFQRTYKRNFSVRALGFRSIRRLVRSLDKLLIAPAADCTPTVFHRTPNGPVTMGTKQNDQIINNLINMIRKHPNGYCLGTLALVYQRKYQTQLSFETFGFKTMKALVESLSEHLFIRERKGRKRVVHVVYNNPGHTPGQYSFAYSDCHYYTKPVQSRRRFPARPNLVQVPLERTVVSLRSQRGHCENNRV